MLCISILVILQAKYPYRVGATMRDYHLEN